MVEFYRSSDVPDLWHSTVRITHPLPRERRLWRCAHSWQFTTSPCSLLNIRESTCWEEFLLEASFRNRRTIECNHIFYFCVHKLFLDENKWIRFYPRERLVQYIGVKKKPTQTNFLQVGWSCVLPLEVGYVWDGSSCDLEELKRSTCLCILLAMGLDFVVVPYKWDLAYVNARWGFSS